MPYVGAPYNFVRLSEKTYTPFKDDHLKTHGRVDNDLLSGEISYVITAKTPIFVDNGKESFFKNEKGEYAIPGSTLRGLIRSNVQILSSSDIADDIDDHKLMYRNVAAGALKNEYNTVLGNKTVPYGKGNLSVLKNVKAGGIKCQGGKYYIYPTVIDAVEENMPNYYILSERTIVDSYLKEGSGFPYDLFVKDGKSIMQHMHDVAFEKQVRNGRTHYIGEKNNAYKPYWMNCSYKAEGKNVKAVSKDGQYRDDGFVISSGKMNEKKAIYIIPEIDFNDERRIEISEADVRAYKIDYKNKENTLRSFFDKKNKEKGLKEAEAFFGLPKEGELKPVFYIELDDKLYFGFTPRLRLFYKHSIMEGYSQRIGDEGCYDMATSLFGLADNDRGNYKSKVAFTDAIVSESKSGHTHNAVLAEPKPTSYWDYLVQPGNGKFKTYDSDSFEIRGIKQYWLRNDVFLGEQNSNNSDVGSTLAPLDAGAVFKGHIRFNNLTPKELGLLLWAIQLEPGMHMNIGKGKPYGFGHIIVSDVNTKIIDNKKAYDLNSLTTEPYQPEGLITANSCVEEYKKTEINGVKVTELPSVKDFFRMKNADTIPSPGSIRYMSINNGEYQARVRDKAALGSIEDVLSGHRTETVTNHSQQQNNSTQKKEKVAIVRRVNPDNKDPQKRVAMIDGGMAFNVDPSVKQGDSIIIKVTSEKDGKIYGNYIRKQ